MRGLIPVIAILSVACATSCSNLCTCAPKPTSLIVGETLEGWDSHLVDPAVKTEDVWSVQDGMIVCKGEPLGYLFTKERYTSFTLTLEWRWAPGTKPGNNGVLLRINGEPEGVPRCIEAQLQSGNAGDLYGFRGMVIDGDPDRLFRVEEHEVVGSLIGVKKIEGAENSPGEWNRYEISAIGPDITVHINGKKVNEATGCDVLAGPIGIQSEGGEIHFRNIVVTPVETPVE